jgi:hypothetical protein
VLAVFVSVFVLTPWRGVVAAEPESEPRLSIPGGQTIAPGRLVELQWTAADSVRELEILLSRDGGRTYSVCISPELDPRARRFRWRVPDFGTSELRLRIRFNRRGREIEGPPTRARIAERGADAPDPLGLPRSSAEPRESRPGNEPRTSARGPGMDPGERTDSFDPDGPLRAATSPHRFIARRRPPAWTARAVVAIDRAPRCMPMRT